MTTQSHHPDRTDRSYRRFFAWSDSSGADQQSVQIDQFGCGGAVLGNESAHYWIVHPVPCGSHAGCQEDSPACEPQDFQERVGEQAVVSAEEDSLADFRVAPSRPVTATVPPLRSAARGQPASASPTGRCSAGGPALAPAGDVGDRPGRPVTPPP